MNKKINKKRKRKQGANRLVIWPLIILIVGFLAGSYLYTNHTEQAKTVKEYFNLLNNKKYEEMYNLVEVDMEKEQFVDRIKNIYEGIEAKNISVKIVGNTSTSENITDESSSSSINVSYKFSMETLAGSISFSNTVPIEKVDDKYKIKWNTSMIFPELENDEKIRIKTIPSKRGTIFDRNGYALAKNSSVYEVGIKPGKLENKADISKIAKLLDLNALAINKELNSEYVTDESFVFLKKISREEQQLKNDLLKIKGIVIGDVDARVYPYKEATSIMTGYIQDGNGVSGLEHSFNDKLKGKDGAEIYIEKNNKIKKSLIKKEAVDGKDIKTTIDVALQQKIYEEFKDDESAVVSINYNTGEVMALVSTPAYDANKFSLGINQEEWENIQNDERKIMYNRYLATYTPGSTFKPIIGAIGLSTNSFTAEENFERSGKRWQKDSSWGNFYVTTMEEYTEPSILENALIYSDNIYFAKAALKIGKNNLEKELNNYGFNTKIDFEQEIATSVYGELDNEKTIANTGYGQADVMVNPILMASIYSGFANKGNMVKPYLVYEEAEDKRVKYFNENAISEEIANTIKKDMIEVVEKGSATDCIIDGKTIAGKTGTAEIKKDQKDENGTENGWFNSFDENGNLFISMVQNVKGRGGSKYVVKKVRKLYEE